MAVKKSTGKKEIVPTVANANGAYSYCTLIQTQPRVFAADVGSHREAMIIMVDKKVGQWYKTKVLFF